MTEQTWQPRMIRIVVLELRVSSFALGRLDQLQASPELETDQLPTHEKQHSRQGAKTQRKRVPSLRQTSLHLCAFAGNLRTSFRWLRYRTHVTRRYRFVTKHNVALCTNKRSSLVSLVNFVIENPAIIGGGGDMTTFSATTRFHGYTSVGHIRRDRLMALRAGDIRMRLVTERARGSSFAPRRHGPPVLNTDCSRQLLIEISNPRHRRRPFMTPIAVRWQRGQLTFLVVTAETRGMRQRPRLERTFLQPESIANIFRRLDDKLVIRLVLRLMGLVTVCALRITVFVMRKRDLEIRYKLSRLYSRQKTLTETRKRKSSRVVRSGFDVTIQTDARHRALPREELLPVTAQACLVLWIFRHVGKSVVRLPGFFPVLRRERMT